MFMSDKQSNLLSQSESKCHGWMSKYDILIN